MKRVLILSLCAVLCGASPALASQLAGTLTDVQGDTVTVNYAVTSNVVTGIDQVDFTIGSISGGAAYIDTLAGGGTYGSGGGGLFTPSAGGYIGLSTSTSLWPSFADSNIGYAPTGFPVPGSWINLDTYQTSGSRGGSGVALTGVTSTGLYGIKGYTSFAGVWASTVSDNSDGGSPPTYYPQFPTIGAELACIYVTRAQPSRTTGCWAWITSTPSAARSPAAALFPSRPCWPCSPRA